MIDCGVCVIRNDRNEYLIAQRKDDDSFGGYWEFPGGKREEGESLEACAVREAQEEVNLNVQPQRFLMTVKNPYQGSAICLHFFLCHVQSGEAAPLDCQAIRWVLVNELRDYLFPPANESVIAYLLKNTTFTTAG